MWHNIFFLGFDIRNHYSVCYMIIIIFCANAQNGLFTICLATIKSLMFVPHTYTVCIRRLFYSGTFIDWKFSFCEILSQTNWIPRDVYTRGVPSITNKFHSSEWNEQNVNLNVNRWEQRCDDKNNQSVNSWAHSTLSPIHILQETGFTKLRDVTSKGLWNIFFYFVQTFFEAQKKTPVFILTNSFGPFISFDDYLAPHLTLILFHVAFISRQKETVHMNLARNLPEWTTKRFFNCWIPFEGV